MCLCAYGTLYFKPHTREILLGSTTLFCETEGQINKSSSFFKMTVFLQFMNTFKPPAYVALQETDILKSTRFVVKDIRLSSMLGWLWSVQNQTDSKEVWRNKTGLRRDTKGRVKQRTGEKRMHGAEWTKRTLQAKQKQCPFGEKDTQSVNLCVWA